MFVSSITNSTNADGRAMHSDTAQHVSSIANSAQILFS
jgi:hypothetical protein